MLVVHFDPARPRDEGQFHVRLIDAKSGDFGNDAPRQNQVGYWCDLGHLQSGVLRPVEAAVEQHDRSPRTPAVTEQRVADAVESWYSARYPNVQMSVLDRRDIARHIAQRLGIR